MKQTKALFAVVAGALAILALTPASARASSVTFTLNCSVTGASTCGAPAGSFGTVSLTDDTTNSAWVDLTVTLSFGDPSKELLSKLFLNYAAVIPAGYNFTTTDGETLVNTGTNAESASTGYTVAFDIKLTDNDTLPVNPYTTVLKLQKASNPDIDLNALDFDAKDVNGLLFALVNHSGAGSQVGATSDAVVTTTAAAVPEPATWTLLGAGLVALRVVRTRLTRQQ